jgi:type II secretion system protein J
MKRSAWQRGFTLIEVLVTMFIVAIVMFVMFQVFAATLDTRHTVAALEEPLTAGPRILTLLERDLQALWHYNIKGNRVLLGQNRTLAGIQADRIDFLCTRPTCGVVKLEDESGRRTTLAEVGYWLREDRSNTGLLELWRREDPLVDDEPWKGGTFQLVHDRMRSFNITYFDSLGREAEPIEEWDAEKRGALPRRLRVRFEVERKGTARLAAMDAEVEDLDGQLVTYERDIVLDRRVTDIVAAGVAMVPVRPVPPVSQNQQQGGGNQLPQMGQGGRPGEPGGQGRQGQRGAGGRGGMPPGGRQGLPPELRRLLGGNAGGGPPGSGNGGGRIR